MMTFSITSPDGITRAYNDRGERIHGSIPDGLQNIVIRSERPMVDDVMRANEEWKARQRKR